ncbi:MAG: hypothetical protein ABW056_00990 [Thermoanaerobaculia bacterium]
MRAWKASAVWMAVALVRGREAGACSPVIDMERRCPEAFPQLCAALHAGSLEERRAAVRAALFADTPEARQAAAGFLASTAFQIDLRPYADIFQEYCAGLKPACFWRREDDYWAKLRFDPRPSRLETLERFIQTGRSEYPRGELPRYIAVQLAASQGLGELEPMILEYLATLTPAARTRFGLDMVPAQLELTRGAEDAQDAAAAAGERLAALEDDELFRRMEEEGSFREAVLREAEVACKRSILTGKSLEACALYAGVVSRQKARFPDRFFSGSGCSVVLIGEPLPKWVDGLNNVAGSLPPSKELETPAERPERPERTVRLDPCSVPDLPGSEHWNTEPTWGGIYSVVLREASGSEVGIADGLVGHRPGETVRLRMDIRDKSGSQPTFPVAVRVSLLDSSDGTLSPMAARESCRSLRFFWNRAGSHETSLVDTQEFEYTVGRAEIAGMVPDASVPGVTVPLWRSTAKIRIDVARVGEPGGLWNPQGGGIYDVRPVGQTPKAGLPNPFEVLTRKKPDKRGELESFGPDLEPDYQAVLHQPVREYWALVDESEKADSKVFACRAQLQDRPESGPTEEVTLRRLGRTSIFVGPVTLAGDGTPLPGSELGRALTRPFILLECCGFSDHVCDPKDAAP